VGTTEEILGRKSSVSGLGNQEYGRRDQSRSLYQQKLAVTLPTSGGRSIGIQLLLKIKTYGFVFVLFCLFL
jgi:hypothetical protein